MEYLYAGLIGFVLLTGFVGFVYALGLVIVAIQALVARIREPWCSYSTHYKVEYEGVRATAIRGGLVLVIILLSLHIGAQVMGVVK